MSFGVTNSITLAAAVPNASTFTLPYPVGMTQAMFQNGLQGTAHTLVLNDNDVITSGFTVSFDASVITVTNSSLGTLPIGTRIRGQFDRVGPNTFPSPAIADNDVIHLNFPVTMASVTAGDYVNGFRAGVHGVIEHLSFVPSVAGTGAGATITFTPKVNTTPVTGGALVVTLADSAINTAVKAGALATAGNVITPTDLLSLTASAITVFTAGSGMITVRIRRSRTSAG
jgi:hypothetical protein